MEQALEQEVDAAIAALRLAHTEQASRDGLIARTADALDRWMRTDEVEYLDRTDFPEHDKRALVRGVHMMNVMTASYWRFFRFLRPQLEAITRRTGRPPRLLELASGAGGFALALGALAQRHGLSIDLTGSDIVPLYVETANAAAAARKSSVTFRLLDALDMSDIGDGAFDLVFIAQSAHHFPPGKLARMIAEAERIATTGFVSFDGFRSLHLLAFVAGTSLLSMRPAMIHDAVTSARKFYAEPELRLMATMAAPAAAVRIARLWPINSVLAVGFHGASV